MNSCSLTLYPYGKQPFTIGLLENDGRHGAVERIIKHSTENINVFSDLSYEFSLNYEDISSVRKVRVYINDSYEPSTYTNGHIFFPANSQSDRRIFLDCYGFAELTLVLVKEDNSELSFSSEYLPVLVRRGDLNKSVEGMVSYVYNHQEALLMNGDPKPRNLAGLKESKYNSLTAQLILAEEIAAIYESSYGYFKANRRFNIEKTAVIDNIEHLHQVTPATLRYIASHPEQLQQINSNTGVHIGNKVYQPKKVLSLQNVYSYDIYENRVVLGFLRKMINEVLALRNRCEDLLLQIPKYEDYSPEYIYSSFFMFAETKKSLENTKLQLIRLHEKYLQLWGTYSNALNVTPEQLNSTPRTTAIFMSVPNYNRIFVRIHQWFSFGIYNFSKEQFMLSFIKISNLYESYLLAKMIDFFTSRGYELTESLSYHYPVPKNSKYKNTRCNNTFSFTGEKGQITLYYQPVVFDSDQICINGINLYRNNTIAFRSEHDATTNATFYTPDFLIKLNIDGTTKYLIMDAKFSTLGSVKQYYLKNLVFKYLFSISPRTATDIIAGMCIIYGKCTENEQLQSLYDKQIPGNIITPFADIMPLIEGISPDSQYNKFDILMRKLLA